MVLLTDSAFDDTFVLFLESLQSRLVVVVFLRFVLAGQELEKDRDSV